MLKAAYRARVLAALAFALPITVSAYDRHGGQVDDRLVNKYSRFAGSEANADALVEGLRYDRPVKLISKSGSTTSFTPDTHKMGWGNVDNALAIAKGTLARHGIYRPTPDQIKAALDGGTITTKSGERVVLKGVLDQRANGMGWGKIAKQNGFKLGEVKGHGHKHGDRHRHDWKYGDPKDWKDRDHDRHHWKHGDRKDGHKHADWKHDNKRGDWKHDRHDGKHDKHDRHDWKRDKHADWKHDRHDRKHDRHDRHDWKHDRHDWKSDWKHDRGDHHRARFDRPERPHKHDRPERVERPERHRR